MNLNNLITQDHQQIKTHFDVMLALKRFCNADVIITGIELIHQIRKGQFRLRANIKETAALAVWNAVLSA